MNGLNPVSLKQVSIEDAFWSKKQSLIRESVIPYQWQILNDQLEGVELSHTIENFRIAAGMSKEQYYGMVFQDSDLAKWLEAVGYALTLKRDPELERQADETIDLLEKAQQPDGYLNSYYTVVKPEARWSNLRDDHELYCAGHMMEAAVAYYEATGKRKLLDIMSRMTDCILQQFGTEPGKKKGYPGHPEIELALVKMYRATGESKYLKLSSYFVDERGRSPHYFTEEAQIRGVNEHWQKGYDLRYSQSHLPVREQEEAAGHAVRAVYLYAAMADLAAELGDESLLNACRRLWDNVTRHKLYIIGGIGSSAYHESFTINDDLPNDRAYTETCAAIGLIFWAQRMQKIDFHGRYADVMERALYNNVISGMSQDGYKYFYVNPLEVWPAAAAHRHDLKSAKPMRQSWYACACCPPNLARLIASLGGYIYSAGERGLAAHLFVGSRMEVEIEGSKVRLTQETDYPWDGKVKFTLEPEREQVFSFHVRIPSWCSHPELAVNGEIIEIKDRPENGYLELNRSWKPGDVVELSLPMPVEIVRAHPAVKENAGKLAIQRGPVVYCAEEVDNEAELQDLEISAKSTFTSSSSSLFGGVTVVKGTAWRTAPQCVPGDLYHTGSYSKIQVPFTAVPYHAWGNRGEGEMRVWIREKTE